MMSKGIRRALKSLRRPGVKLVLTFSKTRQSGRAFCISPQGDYVADETAQALIKRHDVCACDDGLFADRPQSWRLSESG
jgi:hypothetical protein